MAEQEGDAPSGAAAEQQSVGEEDPIPFSFMDKVKFMMYGEQEKEAFLMEKKEKEEKKKAKRALKEEKKLQKKKELSSAKVEEEADAAANP